MATWVRSGREDEITLSVVLRKKDHEALFAWASRLPYRGVNRALQDVLRRAMESGMLQPAGMLAPACFDDSGARDDNCASKEESDYAT
jgi:hypothetical protein